MELPSESYFSKTTKMYEIVQYDYHLLAVINRFDIKLGFGNKTIGEICTNHKINPDFFVMIINLYCFSSYNPSKKEKSIHRKNSLEYLHKTNKYFLFVIMRALQEILNELKSESKCTQMILTQRFLDTILMILYQRNNKFEQRLNNPDSSNDKPTLKSKQIMETQSNLEEITSCINSIKNTLIRFYKGINDDNAIHALFLIFRFEKELMISYSIEMKTIFT